MFLRTLITVCSRREMFNMYSSWCGMYQEQCIALRVRQVSKR
jgi:hypothetical protein